MSAPSISQLVRTLARRVSESERKRARLHLLDWLACVAGARGSQAAGLAQAGQDVILSRAAFLGNVLEMDDVHRTALLHPGPVIWPAALGGSASSMEGLLDAAVRGYEAMIAIGSTLDAHHYRHWHPTATAGVFGAAACEISAAKGTAEQMGHALALAGSVSGGFWQMRHSDNFGKQWHVAHAVETGRSAAQHAQRGVTGPLDLLEGEQGLFAAMTTQPKPFASAGDGWLIDQVSFKPWAACRHAHPVIDCAIALRQSGKLDPPFIVKTYRDALIFCDKLSPQTELQAKFSLQHAVAVIADGRDAAPRDFTLAAIEELAHLRAQVTVMEADEFTARYPAHFGASVNGLALADTRGDPERPIAEADIIAKMHMLADWGGLSAQEAERAVDAALNGQDKAAILALLADWLGS